MEDLTQLRDAIDAIDAKLLGLLNDRARLAQEIGRIKERNGSPVYAPERAEQLMRRLASRSTGPLGEAAIRAIYREIMSASLALEKDTVIACGGAARGRAHLAAKEQFGSSVRYAFHTDPADLFHAVSSGDADCGVIPFGEEGPDAAVLELLASGKVFLCSQILFAGGEAGVRDRHVVLGSRLNSPSGDDQTALLIHLTDHPGALASALEPFREAGVNVISIHSRQSRPGGLHLFLEVAGHADDAPVCRALGLLATATLPVVVCGSYPRFS
jgi:chorismate mutase-like protein